MKGYYYFCLCLSAFAGFSMPAALYACDHLQEKAESYTRLKRHGGSALQMSRWEDRKKDYTRRYRECLKAQPTIHRATGERKTSKRAKVKRLPLRRVDKKIQNPVIHQLLATCNYWIVSYNNEPTPDHQSYRDTACRALDEAEQHPPGITLTPPIHRPLKECIKPDNLLDDEVRECMLGLRAPDWR